eukprot:9080253-Pyramimonas_sp.AAC.1
MQRVPRADTPFTSELRYARAVIGEPVKVMLRFILLPFDLCGTYIGYANTTYVGSSFVPRTVETTGQKKTLIT